MFEFKKKCLKKFENFLTIIGLREGVGVKKNLPHKMFEHSYMKLK